MKRALRSFALPYRSPVFGERRRPCPNRPRKNFAPPRSRRRRRSRRASSVRGAGRHDELLVPPRRIASGRAGARRPRGSGIARSPSPTSTRSPARCACRRGRQIAKTGWGPKLIIGARLAFTDAPDLLVWAPDRAAYASSAACSRSAGAGRRRANVTLSLRRFSRAQRRPCSPGRRARRMRPFLRTVNAIQPLRDALGDRLSLVVSRVYGGDDETRVRNLARARAGGSTSRCSRPTPCTITTRAPAASGRAHLRPPRLHDPRGGLQAVPQRRAVSQIAGADAPAVRRASRRRLCAGWRSPSGARSASTS